MTEPDARAAAVERMLANSRAAREERERRAEAWAIRRPFLAGWGAGLLTTPAAWALALCLISLHLSSSDVCLLVCAEEGSPGERYLGWTWTVLGIVMFFVPIGVGLATARSTRTKPRSPWWFVVLGIWVLAVLIFPPVYFQDSNF